MIKKQLFSFKNALFGLKWIIKTQRNFKISLFLSILAFLGALFFQVSYLEFLLIVFLIFIGLAVEAINTAIEKTIDALHKEYSYEIKIAKDVSAAGMLIFSLGAFIIAWIIFIPRILHFLILNFKF